jgi:hypothetical protein
MLLAHGQSLAVDLDGPLWSLMATVNAQLEQDEAGLRLEKVEYLTGAEQQGREVLFSDLGNKRLAAHFVPGDPRRQPWSGPLGSDDDITWATDLTQGDSGGGLAATQAAIDDAMATWQHVRCSDLPLTRLGAAGDIGFLEFLLSGGAAGSPAPAADITHGGFFTAVDVLLPPPIIAATFTLVFIDDNGEPTDIDADGRTDVALREIYYTGNFPWGDGSGDSVDVETVVLHETGHGLSQEHFGKLLQTQANGKFHFAPRALMNAGYTGVQRTVAKTDNAGHCGIWASWPRR